MTNLTIDKAGRLMLADEKRTFLNASPVGILIHDGCAYLPDSAEIDGTKVVLHYPCGDCTLTVDICDRYHKLTVCAVPEGSDGFIFGPYTAANASSIGEIIGAGWADDGSAVCIQALMPKVSGGLRVPIRENRTGLSLDGLGTAAANVEGNITLQCSAHDRTRPTTMEHCGMKDALVLPVPGPDGTIPGAAVALLTADSADELLDIIGEMELAEGLPHPTYHGNFAKKDRRAASYYLILGGSGLTNEERIRMAGRAGVSCVYFSSVIDKWGHFTIDKENFPGGIEEVAQNSDIAKEYGVDIGAHTLSNFIHTFDEYVTPVPHDHLLVMDRTTLTKPLGMGETEVFLADENNYSRESTLNVFRVGDELITFEAYDAERGCVTGCKRGAFDTVEASHEAGTEAARLWDHGYRTLFPDIELQNEVADAMGVLFRDGKIRRMSFDGLEGCYYTGAGEYAVADFVRRVFAITGNEMICDGSITSHYLWHAFTYCNWGEPWYDDVRRGGMYANRMSHLPFFKRNLIPCMMGWYAVWLNRGRYEATPPENMEFILSRAAAFDAGLALSVGCDVAKKHGLFGEYLDLTRLWGDFRLEADIPDDVRERLQEETSNWHLEKTDDGWKLTELIVRTRDLDYGDRIVEAEAGLVDNKVKASTRKDRRNHSSHVIYDGPYEGVKETLRFRIRVGEPGHGLMENPEFPNLKFKLTAEGGDYLVYDGGMELYHYDPNFNLKEVVTGEGTPIVLGFSQIRYTTDLDDYARYTFTEFRTRREYQIKPKK